MTGSASGIGAATADRLAAAGHRVIGVDVAGADVVADLGTTAGRAAAGQRIGELAGGRLDGLVTAAGLGGGAGSSGARLVAVNYFGTVDLVLGLRPLLAAGRDACVVCLGSNSATVQPDWPLELAEACLAGDEPAAVAAGGAVSSIVAYPAVKAAISWWVRGHAPEWMAEGVRLNVVAPGLTDTPMSRTQRADAVIGDAINNFPVPLGRAIEPDEIADVIAFVLAARAFVGSVVVADGGTEALLRPRDWPTVWTPGR